MHFVYTILKTFEKKPKLRGLFILLSKVVLDLVLERVHSRDLLIDDGFNRLQHWHICITSHFRNMLFMLSDFFLELGDLILHFSNIYVVGVDHVGDSRFQVLKAYKIIGLLTPLVES